MFLLKKTEPPKLFEIVFESYGRVSITFSKNLAIQEENEERGEGGERKYTLFILHLFFYAFMYPRPPNFLVPVTSLVTADILKASAAN